MIPSVDQEYLVWPDAQTVPLFSEAPFLFWEQSGMLKKSSSWAPQTVLSWVPSWDQSMETMNELC